MLLSLNASRVKTNYTKPSLAVRLSAEMLEDRTLPSTFLWFPLNTAARWGEVTPFLNGNESNWRILGTNNLGVEEWKSTPLVPSAADDVVFSADNRGINGNKDCVVDEDVEVRSMSLEDGYSGTIIIGGKTLTITGTSKASTLQLDSPGTITGSPGGTLTLAGSSTWTWSSGKLKNLDVKVTGQATAGVLGLQGSSMFNTTIDVEGKLNWLSGSVTVTADYEHISKVNVAEGGEFRIKSQGTWGSSDSKGFEVSNAGKVELNAPGTATLKGNYTNHGTTELDLGILAIGGFAEQAAGEFQILKNTTVRAAGPGHILGIRGGTILGDGSVDGNLVLGNDPAAPGYNKAIHGNTNPLISPGDPTSRIGKLNVTESFRMFTGKMDIEIIGTTHDKVVVAGYAGLSVPGGGHVEGRIVGGTTLTEATFLTAQGKITSNFLTAEPPPDWVYGYDDTTAWFVLDKNLNNAPAVPGKVGGRVWREDGLVRDAYEPGVEDGLEGVTVTLYDETGVTVLDTTTTDSAGEYEFADLDAGVYIVSFDRPDGERFAAPDMTTDGLDSDADPETGRVQVFVAEDVDDVSAGLYSNADPIAVDDEFLAHKNTPVAGDVLPNDSDPDGDPLTLFLDTDVSHGTLTLNSDGTFSYTPDTDWTGTDSFTYRIEDDYEGSDTATVEIVVEDTPAPIGVSDWYSTPGALLVAAEDGVLDNDIDQGNGDLVAVLVSGPSHGTLTLATDGSFAYYPDGSFTGTDSFTYRPADDGGPGAETTVTITVTDNPPAPQNDTASTAEDTPVNIDVLANDWDADGDDLTITDVTDGAHGTVVIDDNGTPLNPTDDFVVYTPDADWHGEDSFIYEVDDGYSGVVSATVTVTVNSVLDIPSTLYGEFSSGSSPYDAFNGTTVTLTYATNPYETEWYTQPGWWGEIDVTVDYGGSSLHFVYVYMYYSGLYNSYLTVIISDTGGALGNGPYGNFADDPFSTVQIFGYYGNLELAVTGEEPE